MEKVVVPIKKYKTLFALALIVAVLFIVIPLVRPVIRGYPRVVKAGDIVYFTKNGKSYHSTGKCPSLSISNILSGLLDIDAGTPREDPCNNCVKIARSK